MLALAAATSALALVLGRKGLRLSRHALAPALLRAAELTGLTLAFLASNVLVGVAAVLALRAVGRGFYSMYLNTDATLIGISLLQAAVWQWWRHGGLPTRGPEEERDAPAPR